MSMEPRGCSQCAKRTGAAVAVMVFVALVFLSSSWVSEASQGGGAVEWQLLSFPGIEPTRFLVDREHQIEVDAKNSSAVMYRPVAADEGESNVLRWRWRVEMANMTADLSRKGHDDRPLAIHLLFPPKGGERSPGDGAKATDKPDLRDLLANGFVLTYVWGGAQGQGARVPNPYFEGRGWQIILRDAGAQTRRWFEEEVNFDRDFEKAFGFTPPMPGFIAISGDSDDSSSHSIGKIADVTFIDE